MLNAINKEMHSINKHLIMSNCLTTQAGIKHEKKKNNTAPNSILDKLFILTELIDKAN